MATNFCSMCAAVFQATDYVENELTKHDSTTCGHLKTAVRELEKCLAELKSKLSHTERLQMLAEDRERALDKIRQEHYEKNPNDEERNSFGEAYDEID